MNRIDLNREALARSLILSGETARAVAKFANINKNTAWTLTRRIRAEVGLIKCPCGKISGHREWCSYRISKSPARIAFHQRCWKDIGQLNILVPSRPRYERHDIPNERETEIPLLINRRNIVSLDAPVFELENGHTLFKSPSLTPLEILLIKEEIESSEYQDRQRRIAEWNRWQARRQSAFSNLIL